MWLVNTIMTLIFPRIIIIKGFAICWSANIKFSKTQPSKITQLGRLLWRTLQTTGLLLIGNVLKPKAKSVLVTLGLTVAVSATDAIVQKKIFALRRP